MRLFALSDIHVDFPENLSWIRGLSHLDYQEDILLLGGDVSDNIELFVKALKELPSKFRKVFFVPGNHDLWVLRSKGSDSLEKFRMVLKLAEELGLRIVPETINELAIVPLQSWYDYSFGQPGVKLLESWMDFEACIWPSSMDHKSIANHFHGMNVPYLDQRAKVIVSFSHFMPRTDLLPSMIDPDTYFLSPVLGSRVLEQQIRQLGSAVHVYGHSHINIAKEIESTLYLNNAYGYPSEGHITQKKLLEIAYQELSA